MGKRVKPGAQDIHGVLLLDKSPGITSNKALQQCKHLFKAKKAGHTGSLDPLATGLLPICFGEATKISSYLLHADKHYSTVARLGVITDTADADGQVVAQAPVSPFSEADAIDVINRFVGDIAQIPPMYSALHVDGKRLHELARKGIEVERAPRPVRISRINLSAHDETSLSLDVSCSKGTYIRSLVTDIGAALGCGAHVEVLRRTGVDPFTKPRMYRFDELELMSHSELLALLIPLDHAISGWARCDLDEAQARAMFHGRWVECSLPDNEFVRVYDEAERFMALAYIEDGYLKSRRMIVTDDELFARAS